LLPAFLLLLGLAIEAWYQRGTQVTFAMRYDDRLKLGRQVPGAFAFAHNRGREVVMQYARVLPPALRQTTEVRRVALPPDGELSDPAELLPLRLGAGRFGNVPARLLGRFALAWWAREPRQMRRYRGVGQPPGRGRPARRFAGETPRRLPGTGVELLQLRDRGRSLSRTTGKPGPPRHAGFAEYSEAQHLEILLVIDAGRSSRCAPALDRLGLYATWPQAGRIRRLD
jgi:hypothetical protein